MKEIARLAVIGAAAVYALGFASIANAATITCVVGDDRTVTLDNHDGTVSCGPTGSTPPPEGQYWSDLGYTELEKIDDVGNDTENGTYILEITGLGGTSGTISLVAGLVDAVLVFKFGSGGISPDWISFFITGLTSADWSVDPAQQALSHVTLYGDAPRDVPEPTTLALMGLGLLGMGYRLRRRQEA